MIDDLSQSGKRTLTLKNPHDFVRIKEVLHRLGLPTKISYVSRITEITIHISIEEE